MHASFDAAPGVLQEGAVGVVVRALLQHGGLSLLPFARQQRQRQANQQAKAASCAAAVAVPHHDDEHGRSQLQSEVCTAKGDEGSGGAD